MYKEHTEEKDYFNNKRGLIPVIKLFFKKCSLDLGVFIVFFVVTMVFLFTLTQRGM